MTEKPCRVCGKAPLSKDEVGLTKKLIDRQAEDFYCLSCLADTLEASEDELLAKLAEFKEEGCPLFL